MLSYLCQQACDRCRERKSKCDENRPCATCKEQGLPCHYKDSHPTKADKNNQALSDMITEVLTSIKEMSDRLSVVEEHLAIKRPVLARIDTPNPPSQSNSDAMAVDDDNVEELTVFKQQTWEIGDHTTAAHKLLLRWPSIQPFVRTNKCIINENYVMKGEDRGILRLYGAGERVKDEQVNIGAASPAGSSNGDDLLASTPENDPRRSEPLTPGSPAIAMDVDTIDNLFNSYKKNIHRLHPFLDIERIGIYLKDTFVPKHCAEAKSHHSPLFVCNGTGERVPKRRKIQVRSENFATGHLPAEQTSSSPFAQPKRAPERNLTNAIVYLILALGKICETSDPLPGPVQEVASTSKPTSLHTAIASPHLKPNASSPRQALSTVANTSAGVTRAQSWDGTQTSDKRQIQNHDKIAGFVYYREAASILGDFTDSNELAAAQARLLAGLYKGQLARVQESWSWISTAARTCLYRMRM